MSQDNQKPVMSLIPFEGILHEVEKLQGNRPALIVLFSGVEDLTVLKHNLDCNDSIMDMMMKHLTIEVLASKGYKVSLEKKEE